MCANLSAGTPWIVLGDFNVARGVHDTLRGSSRRSAAMDEFEDCLQATKLELQLIISVLSSIQVFWASHLCLPSKRKLFKLRPIARPLILHIIDNALDTSLWFDNWHPDGPIHLKWSSRVIYDSGLPKKAKVSSIVHGDQWVWPCSMSIDLLEIKNHKSSYNPYSSLEDCIKWLPTPDGIYSVASTMASLKTPHPLVPWFELV
ncbi:hypothetical protein Dsin_005711 [Dipteronia sinensis]|uniref:Uncharacterized protein n=1 Tax=Dipteronia sinensis TaxID=43782 RepID=A0AAE0EF63_9ROSI|nr:hypothetical protein Dsin_005711 [Dipteronia sinensis]